MHIQSASRGRNASGVTDALDLEGKQSVADEAIGIADTIAKLVMWLTLCVLFFHVVPQVVAKLNADLAVIEARR